MSENMKLWERLKQPPGWALKQITGGRLKGKTDISPQWRYEAMTEVFGPCGTGWWFFIERLWNAPGSDGQVFAFAEVKVQYDDDMDGLSNFIHGIGGAMLIAKEKDGLYSNDEAYAMAVTDALSKALKMIGVGADIYKGLWDGSKYRKIDDNAKINESQAADLQAKWEEYGFTEDRKKRFLKEYDAKTWEDVPVKLMSVLLTRMEKQYNKENK